MATSIQQEKKTFVFRIVLAFALVSLWWLVAIVDFFFDFNLKQFGLKPKSIEGLIGILTFPFLHGSWQHLLSNSLPGIILFSGLFIFHAKKSLFILLMLYLTSGIVLWLIGKSGTNHIGASGLIYALAFFLFSAGVIIKDRSSVALSFFIILWYGSMIWGIFPFSVEAGTSWEGHLGGAISGVVLALLLIKKPIEETLLEEVQDEEHFFEKHPLD